MAEALLLTLGQSYKSHSQTIGAFGKEFFATGKIDPKFHRSLIVTEQWRRAGDYDVRAQITSGMSEESCQRAKEFVDAAEKYLKAAPPKVVEE